jgi:hypothetical protein
MGRGRRRLITAAESIELWRMYKAGESIQGIGRALSRTGSSVNRVLQSTGGIGPAERLRSSRVLSLNEREEISRGIASGCTIRDIARTLNRAPSTVSQEVLRHGGRMLFDWLVVGLCDRALIATMIYTFGRVGAVIKMRVEDYYTQGRRGWVRLDEKGGKRHDMPCNHNLEAYITAAGINDDFTGYLFRSTRSKTGRLTANPLAQSNVYRMIRRRAMMAGIKTRIGNHTFRATGITQYLRNGGRRELAQQMAAHESPRTTALYDRRDDEVAVDEVERILI